MGSTEADAAEDDQAMGRACGGLMSFQNPSFARQQQQPTLTFAEYILSFRESLPKTERVDSSIYFYLASIPKGQNFT